MNLRVFYLYKTVGFGWLHLFALHRPNPCLLTRVRDKDCVKNRVKRAKIVRFTLC